MTASATPTFSPPNACKVWADGRYLYAELPSLGVPCIMQFSRDGLGLSKLLGILYKSADHAGAPMSPAMVPAAIAQTPAQVMAEAILRRRRLIP